MSKAEKTIYNEQSRHATGVLYLVLGRVEQAVDTLERAGAADPGNAAILTDLAAAYLVRAKALDQPVDLIAALDVAEKAVERNPTGLEALFNRALARQRLSLSTQAVRAWREYLDREADPGWSGEARSTLGRLQAATATELWPEAKRLLQKAARSGNQRKVTELVKRFPQEARSFAEEEALGSWAINRQRGSLSQAEADLAMARAIGSGLVQLSGESMLTDSVADIDQALRDPGRLRRLVDGFVAYQEGLLLVRSRKFNRAAAPLEHARRSLIQASSPFAAWASFLLMRCAYQRSDYGDVESRAHDLLLSLDIQKYPVVAGRTRWVLGSAQMGLALPAEALDSYRFALVQFERTEEAVNQAAVHSLLASAFHELGDTHSAWEHRALALRGLVDHQDPERLRIALTNVAFASLESGYTRAARRLQTEAVGIARAQNDPERLADALLNRASILDRAGLADPERDLSAARSYCERIEDPSIRQSILADLLAVEGGRLSRRAPSRALSVLAESLAMYRAANRRLMLPGVLGTRAIALQALGRVSDAERDLRSAIEMLEEERGSVSEGEQRASFINRAGAVFDAMVLLQTELGHAEIALEYSERGRARLLLDWLSALPKDVDARRFRIGTWTKPRSLQDLQRKVPGGSALLVYEVLPDRLLLWVVRAGSIVQRQVKIPAEEVGNRVGRLTRAMDGPENRLETTSASLHEILIAPVSDLLQAVENVVFVPASPLYSVPFGLLFNPRTSHYLIEEHPVAVTPSLSLFTALAEDFGNEDFSQAEILVLANPAFDRSVIQLPPLPGAEEEGRLIQSFYPGAHIISGQEVGREVFLKGLGRYRVVHFAGHGIANPERPLLSNLVLAPRLDQDDSGILYARDLIGRRAGKTELVILSSCRSAGGAATPGEGIAGLVWPFFSRGVASVIASSRKVDDRETASFFTAFYRQLASGQPPIAALRQAQLEALAESRRTHQPSRAWGAFQIYGAVHTRTTSQKGKKS